MKSRLSGKSLVAVISLIAIGLLLLSVSGYMRDIFDTAVTPFIGIQAWVTSRYTAIYEFFTVPKEVDYLRERNLELENQISELQKQVIEYEQQLREAEVVYSLLDFARSRPENVYVAGSVIARDPSPFLQYIIIDKGSDNDIRYGMPVVTQQGLVGRIDAVTAGAARVRLITDAGSSINAKLQDIDAEGVVTGSLTGDISIEMVPQENEMLPGDLVLTSGLGGNFPADILIGQILSVRKLETELFQSATIQSSVDFANLKAVLIIKDFQPIDYSPLIPEE